LIPEETKRKTEMKKIQIAVSFSFLILLYFGCIDISDDDKSGNMRECSNVKADVLVVVVENNNMVGGAVEYLYENRKAEMQSIFANLFGVSSLAFQNLTLKEIVDQYGEDWQIKTIQDAASGYYSQIISLTDNDATFDAFLKTLRNVASDGETADVIFTLHGNRDSVLFYDRSAGIKEITAAVSSAGIKIRALYQTCCYGNDMIDDWETTGIIAVSGASGINELSMFSPAYFIQNWTSGQSFKDSVSSAYEQEKQKLISYSNTVPEFGLWITDENLTGSIQNTGGSCDVVNW